MPERRRPVTAEAMTAIEAARGCAPVTPGALVLALPEQAEAAAPDQQQGPVDAMVAAARDRSSKARAAITVAARSVAASGDAVTVAAVAREAGVSRQTVYQHRDLLAQVVQLRSATAGRPADGVPTGQRTSEASLHARLRVAQEQIERLRAENAALRDDLALARQAVGDALGREF